MLHFISIRFEESANSNDKVNLCLPADCVYKSAKIVDVDGIAADASNYVAFKVLGNDQTTVLAQWSTQNSAQGALAAGSPASLVDQNKADKALFSSSDMIEVSLTNSGSGKAVDCMIVLEFELAREY